MHMLKPIQFKMGDTVFAKGSQIKSYYFVFYGICNMVLERKRKLDLKSKKVLASEMARGPGDEEHPRFKIVKVDKRNRLLNYFQCHEHSKRKFNFDLVSSKKRGKKGGKWTGADQYSYKTYVTLIL